MPRLVYRTILAILVCLASPVSADNHGGENIELPEPELAQIDDYHIEYFDFGPRDGEAIFFIHAGGIPNSLYGLALEPALHHYRKIVVHRRGYEGSSPIPTRFDFENPDFDSPMPYTFEQHAGDIVQLADHLGLPQVHLLGHTWGGSISLVVARDYPDRVKSLILIEPVISVAGATPDLDVHPTEREAWLGILEIARLLADGGQQEYAELYAGRAFGPFGDIQIAMAPLSDFESYAANMDVMFFQDMPGWATYSFTPEDFARLGQATTYIFGTESSSTITIANRYIGEARPQTNIVELEGADHGLFLTRTAEIAEHMDAHIKWAGE